MYTYPASGDVFSVSVLELVGGGVGHGYGVGNVCVGRCFCVSWWHGQKWEVRCRIIWSINEDAHNIVKEIEIDTKTQDKDKLSPAFIGIQTRFHGSQQVAKINNSKDLSHLPAIQ